MTDYYFMFVLALAAEGTEGLLDEGAQRGAERSAGKGRNGDERGAEAERREGERREGSRR